MSDLEFRDRKNYPGLEGGPFEVLVRAGEFMDNLPGIIFFALLFCLAVVISWGNWNKAFILLFFFLTDWMLMALLPLARISYGPAKPPTLMLALFRLPFALLPLPWVILAQVSGTILVIYGFWIEPQRLNITYHRLTSPKLSSEQSIRLVHFGDLHLERVTRRDENLVQTIMELVPDIILFSGDLLSYSNVDDQTSWDEVREIFKKLHAPHGVFAVRGTPLIDRQENVRAIFEDVSVHLLENKKRLLNFDGTTLQIAGISCSHKPYIDGPKIPAIIGEDNYAFTILLYHSPDLAPISADEGVDLQLSGHTHGGQVRLPLYGALYTSSLYGKRFESGRYQLGSMTLYVTRGLGMEGKAAPRVRFLCPPEITVWDISGSVIKSLD
ncbi:MAG: metallophosphoesterase [Anaerolineales bacterium]